LAFFLAPNVCKNCIPSKWRMKIFLGKLYLLRLCWSLMSLSSGIMMSWVTMMIHQTKHHSVHLSPNLAATKISSGLHQWIWFRWIYSFKPCICRTTLGFIAGISLSFQQ
jgi:hypothetical protein